MLKKNQILIEGDLNNHDFLINCLISSLTDGSALLPILLAVAHSLLTVSRSQSEDDAIRQHKDVEKTQEILTVKNGVLQPLCCNK